MIACCLANRNMGVILANCYKNW